MDSTVLGCLAEYLFCIECLKRDINVSMPLSPGSVYDVVVESKGVLLKIQVKSYQKGHPNNMDSIKINFTSKRKYNTEEVDFFAFYVKKFNGFFIFRNNGERRSIRLSLTNKNSNFFNNFEFD
jgi:hypothetical protein